MLGHLSGIRKHAASAEGTGSNFQMSLNHLPKCCPKLQVFELAFGFWQATAKAALFQIITQQKWLSLNKVRTPFHCHLPGDISGGMKRRSADLSQSTTVRSCLLHQREKAVPCQFVNIELPGCIWFPEYNFVAIFTCLKKYTQVLDLGPPNPGLANFPAPHENFVGLRDVSCISRSQKEEAHHNSHHSVGLTPCQSIPPYTKGFGSPSTPCPRIPPAPCSPRQWGSATGARWQSRMVQEPEVGCAKLELLGASCYFQALNLQVLIFFLSW